MKIVYKVYYENQSGDYFLRYLVAVLQWNGQYPRATTGLSSRNEWELFSDAQDKLKSHGSIELFDPNRDAEVVRRLIQSH
jgi:hypothetical protein